MSEGLKPWQKWAAGAGALMALSGSASAVFGGFEWLVVTKQRLAAIPGIVEKQAKNDARWLEYDMLWKRETAVRRAEVADGLR